MGQMEAILYLEDGTRFVGKALGATGTAVGEVVVQTSMSGLREILVDPTYAGHVVLMTYRWPATAVFFRFGNMNRNRRCRR